MLVYQTDHNGVYVGTVEADPSPLEPGVWLIPGGAVKTAPPNLGEGERAQWTGSAWQVIAPPEPEPEPEPAPPTANDVIAERRRRLALGFEYDFGDARGVHKIGTTDSDMEGWAEVTSYANALIASGDTTTTISIATNTGAADVTASEWQQVLVASAAFRQPIWHASFVLQAMDPIPADYADDKWWSP